MSHKIAAVAAVIISLISVLAGVSIISGDVSADDSTSADSNVVDLEGYSSVYVPSSNGASDVDVSFSDENLDIYLPEVRRSFDFQCNILSCSPIKTVTIHNEGDADYQLLSSLFEVISLDDEPLELEDVCTDIVYDDYDHITRLVISTSMEFSLKFTLNAPSEFFHFTINVFDIEFVYPELEFDLADGCWEYNFLSLYSPFALIFGADLAESPLMGLLFPYCFSFPDGFEYSAYLSGDVTDTILSGKLPEMDLTYIHECIIVDDSVSAGMYGLGLTYFDLMFSELPSSLDSSCGSQFSIYPDYNVPFEVIDSRVDPDPEDPEPVDPEPEDPAPSGDAPVADSEILGIPGIAFWIAAGLLLFVIALAVFSRGGRRR